MTEPAQASPPVAALGCTMRLRPTWLGAWRGVWLLTWRSQLTWKRLLFGVIGLLVLPALVYMTTLSPQGWSTRHHWTGDPAWDLRMLERRLSRASASVRPEQHAALLAAFTEEYDALEAEARASQPPDSAGVLTSEQVRAGFENLRNRARAALDDRQFNQIQRTLQFLQGRSQRRVDDPPWTRTAPFYHWLIDFYFFVILPLGCVRSCGALIRDELQADTLGFLTTRPLKRAVLVAVKYLSQTGWLQLVLLVETLLLLAVGGLRQIPALGVLVPLFLAVQILAVPAWCALGTLLGLVSKRYLALAVLYGAIVELGIGRIPTNINTLSLTRHLKTLLSHNAELQAVFDWTAGGAFVAVAALALASVVFLASAAALFTFREYHHTAEMQK